MEKIFYPESIAIIGLSSKPSNIPRLALENMLRWGYRGRLFGVNPRADEMFVDGVRMYHEVEDLPEVPDLVYCLIPAKFIPDLVERCGKFGVKRMAIPSGGFGEFGPEGQSLADSTLAKARQFGLRFVGPNCLTVANTANGLCFPFAPLLKPPKGDISVITQSGGVGLMILNFLKDENLGLAKFASIGNKLDLDEVDFLEYLGSDPETKVICMYLESISRGHEIIELAKQIDKPIVAYKSNTTTAGKKAAMSHTAAVSHDEDMIDAAFEAAGILRIRDFYDFLALPKAFQLPPMKGKRLVVMSPAGGLSVIMADLCEKAGFEFADPGKEFYEGLQKFTNAGVIRFSNPLDMGDIYDPSLVAHVICSVMHSDRVDGAMYASFAPQMPAGENVFRALFRTDLSKEAWGAILSSGKPLGACLASPSGTLSRFKQAINVPIFNSPEEMIRAMAMQMNYYTRERQRDTQTKAPSRMDMRAVQAWVHGRSGDYGEECLDILKASGVPVAESALATDADQAVAYASKLAYPVAMKVASPDVLHKSDAGGVILGVNGHDEARKAFDRLYKNLTAHHKNARFHGVRVQKMAPEGIDLFVGGRYHKSFGSIIVFGMGGIHMELYRDVAHLLCPARSHDVRQKLEMLKAYSLLKGYRGGRPKDVNAFIDLVVRISHLLNDFSSIKELDINPVRIFDKGSLALDARLRIEHTADQTDARDTN